MGSAAPNETICLTADPSVGSGPSSTGSRSCPQCFGVTLEPSHKDDLFTQLTFRGGVCADIGTFGSKEVDMGKLRISFLWGLAVFPIWML